MKLVALALAVLSAAPAVAAPAGLDEARELLRQSASTEDPAKAQELARRAAEGLLAARRPGTTDCWLVAATAEAQIRSGDPKAALETIGLGSDPACEPAAFTSLAAWAAEYAPDGMRRGPGADLARAKDLYLLAAEQMKSRPDTAGGIASARTNAAELALQTGDLATAREMGLAVIRSQPDRDLAVRAGLAVLGATSASMGEGAASDLVADATGGAADVLRDIIDARVRQVGLLLDQRPGDPYLLVAAGFYSFFNPDELGPVRAKRNLDQAAESGFSLPELSYLRGRAAEALGDPAAAKAFFMQQQREFPAAAASRLAVNDLGLLLAKNGGSPEELAQALSAVDARLKETPGEAALHETRGLLLERMGRKAEALASVERAEALEKDPARQEILARLRADR